MKSLVNSIETLTRLGTFVLAVDDDGVIRWVSERVEAFFGEDVTGARFDQYCVESDRPLIHLSLCRNDGAVVPLRGDWVSWGDDADCVFVGSPAPETSVEMTSVGITLDDFRENDNWLNYLVKLDEAASTQADAKKRIEQLNRQYAEAACMRDKMCDARKASLNMMVDLDRSRKRAEKARSELADTQEKLMDASRHAGMAEIATSVLHNVGNVLNSVNVSATLVSDKIRKSKVSSLAKVTELMREHAHDLGAFLTEDEQGKKLPAYLDKLAGRLTMEQDSMMGELRELTKNIEHIKKIVSTQQSHAGSYGVVETVSIADIVDDALTVNATSFERYGIEMVREYADLPPISLDKQKLMQVLVNLIRNAKHAVLDCDCEEKRLTVRVESRGDAEVRIEVIDTGMGIIAENLTKIFSHGFTTKEDGHGFGLHSAALAAKEMGGSLSVHSDGPGRGAKFTIDLPFERTTTGATI